MAEYNYIATATGEIVAAAILLVLLFSNLFAGHKKDAKVHMYLLSVLFMLAASVAHIAWNINGELEGNLFDGKILMCICYIMSYIGTSFIGYYLLAIIDSRKRASFFFSLMILVVSSFSIIFTIYETVAGRMFIYQNGAIVEGDLARICQLFVILLGTCEVSIILTHTKTLGVKDTLITLVFYILPMAAVAAKAVYENLDLVFAATATAELIVNNMLFSREKMEASTEAVIANNSAKNKSDFLANMSHEIRTPINAVLGLNELILREAHEEAILGYAHDINSSGKQLLNLINDILDFSKIESGKMELIPVDYVISSMINDVVNMISVKTEEKGLTFKMNIDSQLPCGLHGDEVRIKQIITNILSNAAKYTQEGWIELTIGYEKINVQKIKLKVAVQDTGVGMKQEDIGKLFSAFERIDETNNRNIEGTGLGMAITKRYLEMMGSRIRVESEYGKGSRFSFEVEQEVRDWEEIGDYQKAFEELRKENKEYHALFTAPDANILVVDDMPMNLSVLKGLLKETLINIDTAISGEEALELMSNKRYDLIYLDHMMPKMSGIEVLQKLRENKDGPNRRTPAIALTANAVTGAREEYLKAGFSDYLSKPIDSDKLERSLLNYLPKEWIKNNDKKERVEQTMDFTSNDPMSILNSMAEIDVEEGVKASTSEDIFLIVVEEFANSAEETIDNIKQEYQNHDTYEYTVQVHGLKSMCKMIGAMSLADDAFALEMAGKEENWTRIDKYNDELVAKAEQLVEKLKAIEF